MKNKLDRHLTNQVGEMWQNWYIPACLPRPLGPISSSNLGPQIVIPPFRTLFFPHFFTTILIFK